MYRGLAHLNYSFRRFIETFEVNVPKNVDEKKGSFAFLEGHARFVDKGYRARKMKRVGENVDGVPILEIEQGTEFWAACILVNTGPTLPDIRKVNSVSDVDLRRQEQYGLMCLLQFKKFDITSMGTLTFKEVVLQKPGVMPSADGTLAPDSCFEDIVGERSAYMLAWESHQKHWKKETSEDPLQEFILTNHQEYYFAKATNRGETRAGYHDADDDATGPAPYEYEFTKGGEKEKGDTRKVR